MGHRISFKARTGKDLFEYFRAVQNDISTAKVWALENFVLVNGEPITIQEIANLRNDVYIILTEKVFSVDVGNVVEENNTGIRYKDLVIKKKPIHRDFITEIQAIQQSKKSNHMTDVIRSFLVKFFEVSEQELDVLPYEIVAYMFRECNEFLNNLTKHTNELYLDDIFTDSTPGNVSTSLDNLVS